MIIYPRLFKLARKIIQPSPNNWLKSRCRLFTFASQRATWKTTWNNYFKDRSDSFIRINIIIISKLYSKIKLYIPISCFSLFLTNHIYAVYMFHNIKLHFIQIFSPFKSYSISKSNKRNIFENIKGFYVWIFGAHNLNIL